MTAGTDSDPTRVLVVGSDARVTTALAAAIDALPGTTASSVAGTPCDAEKALDGAQAQVAVVDVSRADPTRDLQVVRRLSRRIPVVAVSDATGLSARAVSAGAACLCDKDGDMTALTTAVLAAASDRHGGPGGGD
jgi:DNA-binding NarL/FixJ family response regulator